MRRADHVFTPDSIASDEDVMLASFRTVGIMQTVFAHEAESYDVLDVGGCRGERKKWVDAFEGCHGLVFAASLSGYDECLVEDKISVSLPSQVLTFIYHVASLIV